MESLRSFQFLRQKEKAKMSLFNARLSSPELCKCSTIAVCG